MGIWSKVKKHPCNLLILLMFFRHFSCFLEFFKICNFLTKMWLTQAPSVCYNRSMQTNTVLQDLTYIGFLSTRLRNFKTLKPRLFKFTHALCETSDSRKARAYLYEQNDCFNVKCHHCGYGTKFFAFLRETDPGLFNDYCLDGYKPPDNKPAPVELLSSHPAVVKPTKSEHDIQFFDKLPTTHPAWAYVKQRQIPTELYSRIGFVAKFNQWASKYNNAFERSKTEHPRLIIPFYDQDDSVICYSARAFGREKPKYIKLTVDETKPKIWGLWRVDESRPIVVLEGQIDAMFIDNGVAVSGADYSNPWLESRKNNIIILPDSDYRRNPQVYKLLESAIDRGYQVSFLPDTIQHKDINDCIVKGGMTKATINQLIHQSIKSGLTAKLELITRRKF